VTEPALPPAPTPIVPPPTLVAPAPSVPASGTEPPAPAATGAFVAAPSGEAAASGVQLIQVAAVSSIAKGRELQRDLRAAGFDAYWESVRTGKGDVVRVRISVDRATQSVAETLADLTRRGFKPILVNP
jgi:cell division septation protein DedD